MRVKTPVGLTLDLPPGWLDVTDDIPGENVPFTLGRPQGTGALQFSVGLYRSGVVPDASPEELRSMMLGFAAKNSLGEPADLETEGVPLRLASATFRSDFFVRVWFLSDGRNFAQVTLTSEVDPESDEIVDCEQMLRTIRFDSTNGG